MIFSRRHFSLLFSSVAAYGAALQEKLSQILPSKVYHSKEIAYEGDEHKKGRQFFLGANRSEFNLEMHETILGAGTATHAPHRHEHEEVVIVFEGTVEVFLEGKTENAEAGSVIYFASNQLHSARNAGTTPCRYYVMELRGANAN